jgi:Dickkopf N-terminal cysteine-rich region
MNHYAHFVSGLGLVFLAIGCSAGVPEDVGTTREAVVTTAGCQSDTQCTNANPNTWCNSHMSPHRCVAKKPAGASCNRSSQCISNICSNGACYVTTGGGGGGGGNCGDFDGCISAE